MGEDKIGSKILHEVKLSYHKKHIQAIGIPKTKQIKLPELPQRGYREGLQYFLSEVKTAFLKTPQRVKAAVAQSAATYVSEFHERALGRPMPFTLPGQVGPSAKKGKTVDIDRALFLLYEEFCSLSESVGASAAAWEDLFRTAVGLMDLNGLPPGVESESLHQDGGRVWVFTDPMLLSPDPGALPVRPRGALDARVGDPSSWPKPEPFVYETDILDEAPGRQMDPIVNDDGLSSGVSLAESGLSTASLSNSELPTADLPTSPEEHNGVGAAAIAVQGAESSAVDKVTEIVGAPVMGEAVADISASAEGTPHEEAIVQQFDTAADAEAYAAWYERASQSLYWMIGSKIKKDLETARAMKGELDSNLADAAGTEERKSDASLDEAVQFLRAEKRSKVAIDPADTESEGITGGRLRRFGRGARKPFSGFRRSIRTLVSLAA
ncbi:MAG: hypothetical protein WCI34_08425, partial [Actinomycetes bacterium]